MQLKRSNLVLTVLTFMSLNVNAQENILSPNKEAIFDYSYKQAIEDSDKLKKDWVNPINYKYIYNDDGDYSTSRSFISISQPIFKSGGIYEAIKYADALGKYTRTNIDAQKKEMIKQALDLIFQIKQLKINIKKQELLIENSKLEVNRKKEQVLNGILDTSSLDNAILDMNQRQNQLIDLEHQENTLVNTLSNFTDKRYDEIQIPILELKNESDFIESNIYIKKINEDIDTSYWIKKMRVSQYLPTINFTADYTKYHETDSKPSLSETEYNNVGFNITIPFDTRYSNTIESAKIEYLQKKLELQEIKKEEINNYKTVISKLKSIDKKIDIAKKDVELYDSLLTPLYEQLNVGMTTKSDVQTMENSKKIKAMDIKSLEVDKQIELLTLYYRMEG